MAASKHVADAAEKITEYIDSLPAWSRNTCIRLRTIVLKSDPAILEDWKWGPNYYLNGMVCGFAAFKKHVNFVFFKGSQLKDKRKLLQPNPESLNNRHFKFISEAEIDEDILLEYIIEAIDINKKGKPLKVAADKTIVPAEDIKKEFKTAGVLKYFESLAYSHRKEYVRWIEEAKKQETREKRISKAIAMLGKKEIMHDKYKK